MTLRLVIVGGLLVAAAAAIALGLFVVVHGLLGT